MELVNTQCSSIPEIIRRAFKIALEEKVGAVQIELPQDIAKMDSKIKPIAKQKVLRSRPNRESTQKAAKIILQANTPLLLIGNGCIRGNASYCLRKLTRFNYSSQKIVCILMGIFFR
ncbi:MAG TPA: hypothetical protein VI278_16815 [Nitrososphaeraceae archaeon]